MLGSIIFVTIWHGSNSFRIKFENPARTCKVSIDADKINVERLKDKAQPINLVVRLKRR